MEERARPEKDKNRKLQQIRQILPLLAELYPDIHPLLDYRNCFQLLIAVILSAQCTDAQVNRVTPLLFEKYPGPGELVDAPVADIEAIIFSTGFYKNKARHLLNASALLIKRFDGSVPEAMEDLLCLPGIGRKSANVVRGHCFGLPAIIVDTHFSRVSRRLGLATGKSPEQIEREIAELIAAEQQTAFSMRINLHGRYICKATKPNCSNCVLYDFCDFTADLRK